MSYPSLSLPKGWLEATQQLAQATDALGTPIDSGVMETVIALNVLGVETNASCEGHLDRGYAAPWIDFHAVGTESIRKQASAATKQLQDAEEQHASEEVVQKLSQEMFRLAHEENRAYYQGSWLVHQALEAFYLTHTAPYDQQLYLHNDSFGYSRLQPHGIDYQPQRSPEEQATKLAAYQQEIHAFTVFLKNGYLRT